jgi:hypothetical protein
MSRADEVEPATIRTRIINVAAASRRDPDCSPAPIQTWTWQAEFDHLFTVV